jgi:hypothetical protein
MTNPLSKLDTVEKVLSCLAIVLTALSLIPGIALAIKVILGCYIVELFFYLVIPWEYWQWDERAARQKELIARFHRRMFIVWFSMFLLCFIGGLVIKVLPEATDNWILSRFGEATQNVIVANAVAKLPLSPSSPTIDPKTSVIGIVKGQTLEVVPTPTIGAALLAPASSWFANVAAAGLAFLFVAGLYIRHQEQFSALAIDP